jgi:hypothetical protein
MDQSVQYLGHKLVNREIWAPFQAGKDFFPPLSKVFGMSPVRTQLSGHGMTVAFPQGNSGRGDCLNTHHPSHIDLHCMVLI